MCADLPQGEGAADGGGGAGALQVSLHLDPPTNSCNTFIAHTCAPNLVLIDVVGWRGRDYEAYGMLFKRRGGMGRVLGWKPRVFTLYKGTDLNMRCFMCMQARLSAHISLFNAQACSATMRARCWRRSSIAASRGGSFDLKAKPSSWRRTPHPGKRLQL